MKINPVKHAKIHIRFIGVVLCCGIVGLVSCNKRFAEEAALPTQAIQTAIETKLGKKFREAIKKGDGEEFNKALEELQQVQDPYVYFSKHNETLLQYVLRKKQFAIFWRLVNFFIEKAPNRASEAHILEGYFAHKDGEGKTIWHYLCDPDKDQELKKYFIKRIYSTGATVSHHIGPMLLVSVMDEPSEACRLRLAKSLISKLANKQISLRPWGNKSKQAPLLYAIERDDLAMVQALVATKLVEACWSQDNQYTTPVEYACASEKNKIFEFLLAQVLDPQFLLLESHKALKSIVEKYVKATLGIEGGIMKIGFIGAYNGDMRLEQAIKKKNLLCVKCLVALGADVNQPNEAGGLPLYMAIDCKNPDIVAYLKPLKKSSISQLSASPVQAGSEVRSASSSPGGFQQAFSRLQVTSLPTSHRHLVALPDEVPVKGSPSTYRCKSPDLSLSSSSGFNSGILTDEASCIGVFESPHALPYKPKNISPSAQQKPSAGMGDAAGFQPRKPWATAGIGYVAAGKIDNEAPSPTPLGISSLKRWGGRYNLAKASSPH